jgi:hypothetical protein
VLGENLLELTAKLQQHHIDTLMSKQSQFLRTDTGSEIYTDDATGKLYKQKDEDPSTWLSPDDLTSLRTPSGKKVYSDEATGRMYSYDPASGSTWLERPESEQQESNGETKTEATTTESKPSNKRKKVRTRQIREPKTYTFQDGSWHAEPKIDSAWVKERKEQRLHQTKEQPTDDEENPPIVIDMGSFYYKAGYGGDDAPRACIPYIVAGREPIGEGTNVTIPNCPRLYTTIPSKSLLLR